MEPLAALLDQVVGAPKFQLRRDQAVLYYRESENIEDALTAAGAPKSAMELMEVKIVRDMRNKVNRVTNCETANIDKTVTASARQIADIEYLILSLGLEGPAGGAPGGGGEADGKSGTVTAGTAWEAGRTPVPLRAESPPEPIEPDGRGTAHQPHGLNLNERKVPYGTVCTSACPQ